MDLANRLHGARSSWSIGRPLGMWARKQPWRCFFALRDQTMVAFRVDPCTCLSPATIRILHARELHYSSPMRLLAALLCCPLSVLPKCLT